MANALSGYGYGRDYYGIGDLEKRKAAIQAANAATPNDATNNTMRNNEARDIDNALNIKRWAGVMTPVLLGGAMGQVPADTMLGVLTGGLLGTMAPKWFGGGVPNPPPDNTTNTTPAAVTEAAPTSVTPERDDALTVAIQNYAQANGLDTANPGGALADPNETDAEKWEREMQKANIGGNLFGWNPARTGYTAAFRRTGR